MLENEYSILGVSPDVSDEELERVYYEKKAILEEDRFLDGEAGNEAARKLTELKAAYAEVKSHRKQNARVDEAGLFSEIDAAIKSDDLRKAQEILDGFDSRSAEWHYLQSVVFYKKNWANESKKQLEIALQMDPDNEKYKKAYERMNEKMTAAKSADKEEWNHSGNSRGSYSTYSGTNGGQQMGGDGCAEWCCQMLACNMCLNCLCRCR